jgi:polar amino acid transport system substrate-binding protein
MRKLFGFIFLLLVVCNLANAKATTPIRIAVTHFSPPFVFQTANNELSGFDIDLMMHICETLDRPCEFIPMRSSQVLSAVATNKADVGIGGIDITLTRFKRIGFSVPYMIGEYRFLSNAPLSNQAVNDEWLKNKTIGILKNKIIKRQLAHYANKENITMVEFPDIDQLISALNENSINIAIVHNSTAMYWQNHSSGNLHALDGTLKLGPGLGIPISRSQRGLRTKINRAILTYQKTKAFNDLYSVYFGGF